MKRCIVELAIAIFLVIIAGAHLRLYYANAWYDPSKTIEISEVALLYFFIALGVSYTIWRFHKHWSEYK